MLPITEVTVPVERAEIKNYTPLPATKNRLMLYVSTGDSSVLKSSQIVSKEYVETLTPRMEYDPSNQTFSIIENASNHERIDKAGVERKDLPEAVQKWAEKNAKVINKKSGDRALKIIFGTDPKNVSAETMINFYNKYFSEQNNSSNVKLFIKDIVHLYTRDGATNIAGLKQDLTSIQSLAGSFGATSGEIITQLIDAEVEFQKDQYVDQIDINAEINNIQSDDKRLLDFLIEGQQIDNPKIIPKKITPATSVPVIEPVAKLTKKPAVPIVLPTSSIVEIKWGPPPGYEPVPYEKGHTKELPKKNSDTIESAATVYCSPDHNGENGKPFYSADVAVNKTFANGQSGLIAALDGVGSGGEKSAEAAQIVKNELEKIELNEVPELNEGVALLGNAIVESGGKVRALGGSQVDTTISATMICESKANNKKFILTANVGDSRIYRFNTISRKIEQLTKDNDLSRLLNQYLKDGTIVKGSEEYFKMKNTITKFAGSVHSTKDIDFRFYELNEGDIILSMSDGPIDNIGHQHENQADQREAMRGVIAVGYEKYKKNPQKGLVVLTKHIADVAYSIMPVDPAGSTKHDDICVGAMMYKESSQPEPTGRELELDENSTLQDIFELYKRKRVNVTEYQNLLQTLDAKSELGKKIEDRLSLNEGLVSTYENKIIIIEDKILPKILGNSIKNFEANELGQDYINLRDSLVNFTLAAGEDIERIAQEASREFINFKKKAASKGIVFLNQITDESLFAIHSKVLDKKLIDIENGKWESNITSPTKAVVESQHGLEYSAPPAEKFTPVNSYQEILDAVKKLKPPDVLNLSADSAGFTNILPQIITDSLDQMIKKAKGKMYGVSLVKKPELIAINQKQIKTDLAFKAGVGPIGPKINAHLELKNSSTDTDFETPVIKVDPPVYGDINLQELADIYFLNHSISQLIKEQLGELNKDNADIENVQIYFTDDNKVQLKIYAKAP